MTDPLKIGSNALLAFQRAIAATSHNAANADTEGYTRQRVDFEANAATSHGMVQIGQGTRVLGLTRVENQFITAQMNATAADLGRASILNTYAGQLDVLLGNEDLSVSGPVNTFFSALEDANNHPESLAARNTVISAAEQLTASFQVIQGELTGIEQQLADDITHSVGEINTTVSRIADLNQSIIANQSANRSVSSDLLDQRNRLINDLSGLIDIDTLENANGSINLFLRSGQALLTDTHQQTMQINSDSGNPSVTRLSLHSGDTETSITTRVSGGKLAGLLEFQRGSLGLAFNELGRIALTLADSVNQQHRHGLDRDLQPGGSLFESGPVSVIGHSDNTGVASVAADLRDTELLTSSDYTVSFDGSNYTLTRLSDGISVAGGSVLAMDGLSVTVTGDMAAGDTYTLQPTRLAAGSLEVSISSAEELALASPVKTRKSLASTGSGEITAVPVTDSNPQPFDRPLTLIFQDPPSLFNIVDTLTGDVIQSDVPYTAGQDFELQGLSVKINGNPNTSDSFELTPNTDGLGDNSNGVAMVGISDARIIENAYTWSESYSALIAAIGSKSRQADLSTKATTTLNDAITERRENLSGVNLDEEAINLTRFQQAYQAAAQIINASDTMFQSLMSALR